MEINEFIERRDKLEIDILKAISGIVAEFKKETGYSPCAISVELFETSEIGDDKFGQYQLSNVICNFDII